MARRRQNQRTRSASMGSSQPRRSATRRSSHSRRAASTRSLAATAPLHTLARAAGIHTRYTDGLGNQRTPPPETLLATLRALGHDVDSPGDAPRALQALRRKQETRLCEPVIIAWGGAAPSLRVNLPARIRSFEVRLELEDGGGEYRTTQSAAQRRRATRLQLPPDLPMGIHRLTLEAGATNVCATVLSAPPWCYQGDEEGEPEPRETGIFLPLYALRSRRSWGIGDLGDLDALTTWAGSLGCNLIGTLPLLACYLDEPLEPSPYTPVSRLHFNEVFADLMAAPELARSPAARRLIASKAFQRKLEALRKTDLVDYRSAYAAKRRVLQHLAKAAFADPARRRQIEHLVDDEPTLDDYARFRAAVDRSRTTWQAWRAPQRRGRLTPADYDEHHYHTHLYAQFLMREQLAEQSRLARDRGGRLYLDLPLGAHGGGFDLWRFGPHFARGLATGAPPDLMFTHGQNWGFPPLHPVESRKLGHAYFAAAIRNHLRFAGALRIDHVAGLHRLFCIPHGMDVGTYVDYPSEEFYAILSIESHRAKARIIGENLGNVPPEVTKAMHRRGLLGMWVGQFGINAHPERAIPPIPRENLACLNTHDIVPFAAHWKGLDIPMRQGFGWLTTDQASQERRGRKAWRDAVTAYLRSRRLLKNEETPTVQRIANALLLELAHSNAEILLVNLEDLWAETDSQNIPGTTENTAPGHHNWRRKASRTLEQITRNRDLADLIRRIARR